MTGRVGIIGKAVSTMSFASMLSFVQILRALKKIRQRTSTKESGHAENIESRVTLLWYGQSFGQYTTK